MAQYAPLTVDTPFWSHLNLLNHLLDSSGGKDKVLKLIQYLIKCSLNIITLLKQNKTLLGFVNSIPPDAIKKLESVAKNFSRKLFRMGRSFDSIYQLRRLLGEKNEFLQIMGSTGLFWNAIWFVCDHSAYLVNIGILKTDHLLPLNRICMIAMQTCLNLAAIHRINLSFREEHHLEAQLASLSSQPGVEKKYDSPDSPEAATAAVESSAQAAAKITTRIHHLQRSRFYLWIDFAKCFGDLITGYDFGFNLNLNPLIPNAGGVLAATTGLYLEYMKALKRKAAMAKA